MNVKIINLPFLLITSLLVACATVSQKEVADADFGTLPESYEQSVKGLMSQILKDPYSAMYRFFDTPRRGFSQDGLLRGGKKHFGYIVSVGINARNSFGGYTGEQINYFLFSEGMIYDITPAMNAGMAGFIPETMTISATGENIHRQSVSLPNSSRSWLGVMGQDVNPDLAESFHLDHISGALVTSVTHGGPADLAGIKVGDVISSFNGQNIERFSNLSTLVSTSPPGSKVTIELYREGKSQALTAVLGDWPDSMPAPSGSVDRLKIVAADLSAEERRELDIAGGITITEISSGPALKAGLQKGDILLRFDNTDIKSADNLNALVTKAANGTSIPVFLRRNNETFFIAVKFGND